MTPEKKKIIHFRWEGYYADHSFFPMAFVDYQKVEKYFLFSKAWNRVDIIDLKNLKNLTAAKSLIEDRSYEQYENDLENTHFYPPELDYFYGEMLFSPSGKHFLVQVGVGGRQIIIVFLIRKNLLKISTFN